MFKSQANDNRPQIKRVSWMERSRPGLQVVRDSRLVITASSPVATLLVVTVGKTVVIGTNSIASNLQNSGA